MTTTAPRTYCWHMHHTSLVEQEYEPLERRIQFIKQNKPKDEIETRLCLIKRVKNQRLVRRIFKYEGDYTAAYDKVVRAFEAKHPNGQHTSEEFEEKMEKLAVLAKKRRESAKKARPLAEALHKKECPNCPWNGSTIFPDKKLY